MDLFLTRQLDTQLQQASHRSREFGRPSGTGRPDPLEARGQGVGTLNARIVDDAVSSAGFLAGDATRKSLSPDDNDEILLALTPNGVPVDRTLSAGAYRLTGRACPVRRRDRDRTPAGGKAKHPGLPGLDHGGGVRRRARADRPRRHGR